MARCPFAEWHGDNLTNKTAGKMYSHKGLVVHCDGVDNINADDNWFHNPKAQVSAHFGIRNDGSLVQWVDTDDTAWAEVAGNHYWLSVENESKGEPLTQAQVESNAKLFAWLHKQYAFPLQLSGDPERPGLGHHSMGGAQWGGHFMCPGERIISQKPEIVHRATALVNMPVENPGHPQHKPAPKPAPAPKPKPHEQHPPKWYRRVLAFQSGVMPHGDDVKVVQRKVHITVDGIFGPETVKKVRGFQTTHKLHVDGIVGPTTATALGD